MDEPKITGPTPYPDMVKSPQQGFTEDDARARVTRELTFSSMVSLPSRARAEFSAPPSMKTVDAPRTR